MQNEKEKAIEKTPKQFYKEKLYISSEWEFNNHKGVTKEGAIRLITEFSHSQTSALQLAEGEIKELKQQLQKTENTLTEQGKMYYELNKTKESIQHERDCYYDDTVLWKQKLDKLESENKEFEIKIDRLYHLTTKPK